MSSNPNNAVGTNAAYNGRTSVKAFNDGIGAYSRGILSGWACSPNTGMTVSLGGDGTTRDIAIAEDVSGNKISVNNISESPISVTMSAAPSTNSRIDLIVAYVDNPPQGSATSVDNPGACGLIAVDGTAAANPVAPNDSAIRTAITADGASGSTAYYVVLANITVASGTTDIDSTMIKAGDNAGINANNIDFSTFDSSVFPIINTQTDNNNINSDQYYDQYTYNVTVPGVYAIWFSQRMGEGAADAMDFYARISKNGTPICTMPSGGSSYVSFIQASVQCYIKCAIGDVIKCQSKGGGTGVIPTMNGAVSICRIY